MIPVLSSSTGRPTDTLNWYDNVGLTDPDLVTKSLFLELHLRCFKISSIEVQSDRQLQHLLQRKNDSTFTPRKV